MTFDDEAGGMDAVTLAGRIRSAEMSPVEVIETALRRMERLEPQMHAFCTPTPEFARSRDRDLLGRARGDAAAVAGPGREH